MEMSPDIALCPLGAGNKYLSSRDPWPRVHAMLGEAPGIRQVYFYAWTTGIELAVAEGCLHLRLEKDSSLALTAGKMNGLQALPGACVGGGLLLMKPLLSTPRPTQLAESQFHLHAVNSCCEWPLGLLSRSMSVECQSQECPKPCIALLLQRPPSLAFPHPEGDDSYLCPRYLLCFLPVSFLVLT